MISWSLLGILPCTLYGKRLESAGSWLYCTRVFDRRYRRAPGNGVLYPVAGEQVALFYFLNLITSQVDRGAVFTVAGCGGGGDDRLGAGEHVTNGELTVACSE